MYFMISNVRRPEWHRDIEGKVSDVKVRVLVERVLGLTIEVRGKAPPSRPERPVSGFLN